MTSNFSPICSSVLTSRRLVSPKTSCSFQQGTTTETIGPPATEDCAELPRFGISWLISVLLAPRSSPLSETPQLRPLFDERTRRSAHRHRPSANPATRPAPPKAAHLAAIDMIESDSAAARRARPVSTWLVESSLPTRRHLQKVRCARRRTPSLRATADTPQIHTNSASGAEPNAAV